MATTLLGIYRVRHRALVRRRRRWRSVISHWRCTVLQKKRRNIRGMLHAPRLGAHVMSAHTAAVRKWLALRKGYAERARALRLEVQHWRLAFADAAERTDLLHELCAEAQDALTQGAVDTNSTDEFAPIQRRFRMPQEEYDPETDNEAETASSPRCVPGTAAAACEQLLCADRGVYHCGCAEYLAGELIVQCDCVCTKSGTMHGDVECAC